MDLRQRANDFMAGPELDFVTCVIVMAQAHTRLFEPHSMSTREWHVLLRLAARSDAPTQAELARSLYRDAPAISRVIDQLERKELVGRQRDPGDRRTFRIQLTRSGKRVCGRLLDAAEALSAAVTRELSPAELASLQRAAAAMREAYAQYLAGELAPATRRKVS